MRYRAFCLAALFTGSHSKDDPTNHPSVSTNPTSITPTKNPTFYPTVSSDPTSNAPTKDDTRKPSKSPSKSSDTSGQPTSKPTSTPSTSQPTGPTPMPTTSQPTTSNPTGPTSKPTTSQPTTSNPTGPSPKPTTSQPTTSNPTGPTPKPTTSQPTTSNPTGPTPKPTTSQPTTSNPTGPTPKPTTSQPITSNPTGPTSKPTTSKPTSNPTGVCVDMKPNPFKFNPPPGWTGGNNYWPDYYPFWTSQVSQNGVPWMVNREATTIYFLQSPLYNGALGFRQSNATLQVCDDFGGGIVEVDFSADVKESVGQLFQVVVDGQVCTGGNITTPRVRAPLTCPLSPGRHWVNFVYTWTPKTTPPDPNTGKVKIYSVFLDNGKHGFPTHTPTERPSLHPSRHPSSVPSRDPSSTPSSHPSRDPSSAPSRTPSLSPTVSPTVSPTLNPTVSPTVSPTLSPTVTPTLGPTVIPTVTPTLSPTLSPTVTPTLNPTLSPTETPTLVPTTIPTLSPTLNPTVTPEPTETGQLPTTKRPHGGGDVWGPPSGSWGPPSGSWGPPSGSWGPPSGGWSSPWSSPWFGDSRKGKAGKSKASKSFLPPKKWIPASGGDWMSYSGWDTGGWGSESNDDFSSWNGNDSTSWSDMKFDWDRYGKTFKAKASKAKGSSWISDTSFSDAYWSNVDNAFGRPTKSELSNKSTKSSKKKGSVNNMSMSDNTDWWNVGSSNYSNHSGGVWMDSSSFPSQYNSYESSETSSGQSSKSSKPISSEYPNGSYAGQAGKEEGSISDGKGSEPAHNDYAPLESTQSTKSSKDKQQVEMSQPNNPKGQAEEMSIEEYKKMKGWAETKWQDEKQSKKSAGVRVGPSCHTSLLLLLTSTLAIPMLLAFTLDA